MPELPTDDPSRLPWSPERLTGLSGALQAELDALGLATSPVASGLVSETLRAVEAFIMPRLDYMHLLDVVDALHNIANALDNKAGS